MRAEHLFAPEEVREIGLCVVFTHIAVAAFVWRTEVPFEFAVEQINLFWPGIGVSIHCSIASDA